MKTDIKNEFISVYRSEIKREGSEAMLDYLVNRSDFFTAPASTRFHLACEGGLAEHSMNVYKCLSAYLSRPEAAEYGLGSVSGETAAIVALLHDLCKVNCYSVSSRNVKDKNGVWQSVPYYEWDDKLPYGHGEKSVYIASGFMKLTREEAFAIRYHMGFSQEGDTRSVGAAFEMYPLALALSVADQEATFFLEKNK